MAVAVRKRGGEVQKQLRCNWMELDGRCSRIIELMAVVLCGEKVVVLMAAPLLAAATIRKSGGSDVARRGCPAVDGDGVMDWSGGAARRNLGPQRSV